MNRFKFFALLLFFPLFSFAEEQPKEGENKVQTSTGIIETNELNLEIKTDSITLYLYNNYASTDLIGSAKSVKVPIKLYFEEKSSCIVSCLIKNKEKAIFIDKKIDNIIGFIRIKGSYDNSNQCFAYGMEVEDRHTIIQNLSHLCQKLYHDVYKEGEEASVSFDTGKYF